MIAVATKQAYEKTQEARKVSLKTFMEKYREGSAGQKYEWNNGVIETFQTMKQIELLIYYNLLRHFMKTEAFQNGAILSEETEVWTSEGQFRKPDICFWEKEQVFSSFEGKNNIPKFAVEVISTNDQANLIKSKLYECFNAGFEVIWHIYPQQKVVEVYTSPKSITICTDTDFCSASNVIPDLKITVNDLFSVK